jgi:hypothetical protein
MPIPALALGMGAMGVGSVLGGIFGSSGAKAQIQAAREAIAYQKEKDAATQARFEPYQDLGKENINYFKDWRDDPTKDPMAYLDPGYEFRRSEGMKGVTGNAATAGMLQSGDTLRAVEQYGQGLASSEYNNAFNRWLNEGEFKKGLVGMGQSAAGLEGALLNQGAANVGNITADTDFGASDRIWGDVASGAGGAIGNAFARRRGGPTPQIPGGSNIFAGAQPSQYATTPYYNQ